MINRLCVIGVGLIGGSIARAARDRGVCREIIAVDQDNENLQDALRMGVIDDHSDDVCEATKNADIIVIATPVGAIEAIFTALRPNWSAHSVYTDVGSTKANIIQAAINVFGEIPSNFVPAHPIAGAEKSGVEASSPSLFDGKRIIITPVKNSDVGALKRVSDFWQALGCDVSLMDASRHDAVLAATSHLPHVIAYALVDLIGRKDEKDEIFRYAAGGFKDFTRIASSDPSMWLDICLGNRVEIIKLIEQFSGELDGLVKMLRDEASAELLATFENAGTARARFLQQEPRPPMIGNSREQFD